ncbi:hypothetical protein [Paucihalobacter sp.]|uniref:hypothetical protein n=1 Tax=Paucihalobacter sp. TaxID=2850405 RepID=UPI002FE37A66
MRSFVLLFVALITFSGYAQQKLPLRIVENSKEELTKEEHWFQLEVSNTSSKTVDVLVSIQNTTCQNMAGRQQSELLFKIFDANKKEVKETLMLNGNSKSTFYIKSIRTPNSRLGSWNCANVTLLSSSRTAISQTIELRSLIPNPSNFE